MADKASPAAESSESLFDSSFNFDSVSLVEDEPAHTEPHGAIEADEEDPVDEEESDDGEVQDSEDEPEVSEVKEEVKLKQIDVPEVPKDRPIPPEQAHAQFKTRLIVHCLRENGVDASEGNYEDHMRSLSAYDASKIMEWAEQQAKQSTQAYYEKTVKPYLETVQRAEGAKLLNAMAQIFPDVWDMRDDMQKQQERLYKAIPEMANDPVRALPILYVMAKEAFKGKKGSKPTSLETGRAKAIGSKTKRKEHPVVSALKGRTADPLAGIFNM